MPPESMVQAREDAFNAILAATGTPAALFDDSDGTATAGELPALSDAHRAADGAGAGARTRFEAGGAGAAQLRQTVRA